MPGRAWDRSSSPKSSITRGTTSWAPTAIPTRTTSTIELWNLNDAPVALGDDATPTWRLRDAVDYDFAPGTVLQPHEFVLVVGFDPLADAAARAAFRARTLVPDTVRLFGPWTGELNNDRDSVELRRPDLPEPDGSVPYLLVERVKYSDAAPWPQGADALGLSLQRVTPAAYGNDPANWVAVAPTPGTGFVPGGAPPQIVNQPGDQALVSYRAATLQVTATGTEPLRYQWRRNGLNLPDGTNAALVLDPVRLDDAGTYTVFVYNSAGSIAGTNFAVRVRVGLRFIRPPQDTYVLTGGSTNLSVEAEGTGPLRYQWQFNGTNLAHATNTTYAITNAQAAHTGAYAVQLADDFDTLVSPPAMLQVTVRPVVVLPPVAQTVGVGGTACFTAASSGTTPIQHRWRRQGVTVSTTNLPNGFILATPSSSLLIITNVQLTNAASYSVIVTNMAGQAPTPASILLTVLADTDRDGLPDQWETNHPGFSPDDPADGAADSDTDGLSNAAEWIAGTDYLDPASVLKMEWTAPPLPAVQFIAVSNRTYTVQSADRLDPAIWTRLSDVLARTNSRTEIVIDPAPLSPRYYRLVTPIQP